MSCIWRTWFTKRKNKFAIVHAVKVTGGKKFTAPFVLKPDTRWK